MLRTYTVAFFGHRYIADPYAVEQLLEEPLRNLINNKVYVNFLVGRNGEFDQCVSSTIHRIQRQYREDNSSLTLVLPYPTAEYSHNKTEFHTYYTDVEISYAASKAHPKNALQIRNRELVDRADLIICYVEKPQGGAYQTIRYAQKQRKNIINLFEKA